MKDPSDFHLAPDDEIEFVTTHGVGPRERYFRVLRLNQLLGCIKLKALQEKKDHVIEAIWVMADDKGKLKFIWNEQIFLRDDRLYWETIIRELWRAIFYEEEYEFDVVDPTLTTKHKFKS